MGAHGKVPKNWGKNVPLISSMSEKGMGPSMSIKGSSDTESFGLYMRDILPVMALMVQHILPRRSL